MQKQQYKTTRNLNNQGNTRSQKENNNSPIIKHKVTEFCDLADKELKIAVLNTLSELQENSERQLNEILRQNT